MRTGGRGRLLLIRGSILIVASRHQERHPRGRDSGALKDTKNRTRSEFLTTRSSGRENGKEIQADIHPAINK